MDSLLQRMQWETQLLNRNNLLTISLVVTGLYIGLLQLIRSLGYVELLSILMILNDPAVIGTLFIGITIIFEREQGTLDALRVTPYNPHHYLLGKILVLTLLGTLCGWAMALAGHGFRIDHLHFLLSLFLLCLFFSNLGIILVMGVKRFIAFALRMAALLVFLSLPIFDWFGLFELPLKEIFPTEHAIRLFAFSFDYQVSTLPWPSYLVLLLTAVLTYAWAYRRFIHVQKSS